MTAANWPHAGRCGACGRPALEFPSGTWKHTNGPCRARSQSIWPLDDVHIKQAVRFVAEGEPLPTEPDRESALHPGQTVRQLLAEEAGRWET